MVLFYAVTRGPAYLIFPVISLSPVVTIALSFPADSASAPASSARWVSCWHCSPCLRSTSRRAGDGQGGGWLWMALVVMACWGLQAYFMKSANNVMSGESIFFYMTLTGLALIPVAWAMTDFSQPINYGLDGPWLAAGIQVLNAIGALTLVFAFRYGKAIIVAPLTNAGAPLATAIISMVALGVVPSSLKSVGIILALAASLLLAIAPDSEDAAVASET